jgi:hypothetical protein
MPRATQRPYRPGLIPLLAAIALIGLVRAAAGAVPEYELKAALLYKVAKFVHWPEGAFAAGGSGMHLCLVGHDDFGASIDGLAGQKMWGQVVSVERLPAAPAGAKNCQIVFVSRSENAGLAELLASLANSPTLTVSDIDGFAAQGGMIELATTDSKIHFQINAVAARRAGLEIGAQLLQLATLVTDPRTGTKP